MRGVVTALRDRRGQSLIEYLVVAAAIIGVIILTVGPLVAGRFTNLGTEAGNAIDRSAASVATIDASPH